MNFPTYFVKGFKDAFLVKADEFNQEGYSTPLYNQNLNDSKRNSKKTIANIVKSKKIITSANSSIPVTKDNIFVSVKIGEDIISLPPRYFDLLGGSISLLTSSINSAFGVTLDGNEEITIKYYGE